MNGQPAEDERNVGATRYREGMADASEFGPPHSRRSMLTSAPTAPSNRAPIAPGVPEVEVRRSAKRRRTVSAYRDADRIVVLIPQRFTRVQEQEYVQKMVEQLVATEERRRRRTRSRAGDDALMARADELRRRYLPDVRPATSVRWVASMRTRWASCTPVDGTIRVSARLQPMPAWVCDYVLVHELAHLRVAGHGPEFWELVNRYPRAERARATSRA